MGVYHMMALHTTAWPCNFVPSVVRSPHLSQNTRQAPVKGNYLGYYHTILTYTYVVYVVCRVHSLTLL